MEDLVAFINDCHDLSPTVVAAIAQVSAGKGNRLYEAMNVFSLLDQFEHEPETFIDPAPAR